VKEIQTLVDHGITTFINLVGYTECQNPDNYSKCVAGTSKMLKLVQFKGLSDLNFDEDVKNNIAAYIVKAIKNGEVIYVNDLSGYGQKSYYVAGQVLKEIYDLKDDPQTKVDCYISARTKEKVIVVSNASKQSIPISFPRRERGRVES